MKPQDTSHGMTVIDSAVLERHGISVTTVDLSEIIGAANKLYANAAAVKAKPLAGPSCC